MATHKLALKPSAPEPFIPDEDIERLIAEMFGRARRPAPPQSARPAPPSAVARSPQPALVVAAPTPDATPDVAAPVEPLQIRGDVRRRRRWAAPLVLAAIALGGGWWLASSGLIPSILSKPEPSPPTPPVIAAAPAPTSRVVDPPADSPTTSMAPAAPPQTTAAAPAQPTPAEPVISRAPQPQPLAALSPPPAPPAPTDSAGILGTPQPTPFDQGVAPRAVRTTAVIPPRSAEDVANTVKPIDFDDPATWPPGAEKAEPHPLPPKRAR